MVRVITAREPDLVHAIVEADDSIVGHRGTNLLHKMRWIDRETLIARNACSMCHFGGACLQHEREIPVRLRGDRFLDLPDRVGNIANHLDLREIDRIDLRRPAGDMDHLGTTLPHEEWRLFDHIVPDIDDAVRCLDCAVNEIACRKRRATDESRVALVDHALAQLGGEERDSGLFDEFAKHLAGHGPVGAGADDQDRRLCSFQPCDGCRHGFGVGARAARDAALQRKAVGMFVGNIFGQLDMDGARLFLFGKAESLAHPARDIVR